MGELYELRTTYNQPDSDWDNFLTKAPGGHHAQSSQWARVYEALKWLSFRVTVVENKKIIAGAQVLFKRISSDAAFGYVPKGPVFTNDVAGIKKALFSELSRMAQENKIFILVIQPPHNSGNLLSNLSKYGFYPSKTKMGPTATTIIDLKSNLDTILKRMKSRTRYNIRVGRRKGLRIREGIATDIDTYYYLLSKTSQRQRFSIYPKIFFQKLWDVFEPHDTVKMFLSEYNGKIISAQLIVAFGETVTNKMSVWSGEHSSLKPNEALQWYSIRWSKINEYHYYDLEGIDYQAALAILNSEPLPNSLRNSFTYFKLGFGGQVVLLPDTYDYIYNSVMRKVYDNALTKISTLQTNNYFELPFYGGGAMQV